MGQFKQPKTKQGGKGRYDWPRLLCQTERHVHGGAQTERHVHGGAQTERHVHGGAQTEIHVHGGAQTERRVHGGAYRNISMTSSW